MPNFKILDVEITSASMDVFLTQCSEKGINLFNIRYLDDLKVRANLSGFDLDNLNILVNKRGDLLQIINQKGMYFSWRNYLHRPILLVGMILWFVLLFYLPSRVLFVRVVGNQLVESSRVVEAAEKCGIRFGASRRYVRSEKVKNELLSEIELLQWAGVNTFGCVAVISVKERSDSPMGRSGDGFHNMIAERDGIVTEITVTKGTPLCKVGQAVRAGQALVSGYTDCGFYVTAEGAEGEVRAITNRRLTAITQSECISRTKLNKIMTRYSIQIGKNIVKLYHDSGIRDVSCVKIYNKQYLTLPGGFELPISLIEEVLYSYDCALELCSSKDNFAWAYSAIEGYVLNDMIAGRILRSSANGAFQNGTFCINSNFICEEAIGRLRVEKIGDCNGKGYR